MRYYRRIAISVSIYSSLMLYSISLLLMRIIIIVYTVLAFPLSVIPMSRNWWDSFAYIISGVYFSKVWEEEGDLMNRYFTFGLSVMVN